MIEANSLPGNPPKSLIAKVRSELWAYVKSRPPKNDQLWRDVWYWAAACREKQNWYVTRPRRGQGWPSPSEIASQFLYMGLSEMKAMGRLKLPFMAKEAVTPRIAERLAWHARLEGVDIKPLGQSFPLLEHADGNAVSSTS